MRILCAVLSFTTLLSAETPRLPKPETADIERLNDCVQMRFVDRTTFGIRRMGPILHTGLRAFVPENAVEQGVVDRLRAEKIEMIAYLAGRGVLISTPGINQFRNGVQGPVAITTSAKGPSPEWLLKESRTALFSFEKGEGYDVRNGEWTVAMRPLRASSESCVRCHSFGGNGPKVGDALGVVMYVYRHP